MSLEEIEQLINETRKKLFENRVEVSRNLTLQKKNRPFKEKKENY